MSQTERRALIQVVSHLPVTGFIGSLGTYRFWWKELRKCLNRSCLCFCQERLAVSRERSARNEAHDRTATLRCSRGIRLTWNMDIHVEIVWEVQTWLENAVPTLSIVIRKEDIVVFQTFTGILNSKHHIHNARRERRILSISVPKQLTSGVCLISIHDEYVGNLSATVFELNILGARGLSPDSSNRTGGVKLYTIFLRNIHKCSSYGTHSALWVPACFGMRAIGF
mmetsp:Transcript_3804/g.16495  ORF Transcript_3804/g.16495 Transcript_3804/m.16495 type:complete len:225 (+) Transcript_3804:411-1085(+)